MWVLSLWTKHPWVTCDRHKLSAEKETDVYFSSLKLVLLSMKTIWQVNVGWKTKCFSDQADFFDPFLHNFDFGTEWSVGTQKEIFYLDIPVHPVKVLPITWSSSGHPIWPSHWHVEPRMYSGGNAHWGTFVQWCQWGRTWWREMLYLWENINAIKKEPEFFYYILECNAMFSNIMLNYAVLYPRREYCL